MVLKDASRLSKVPYSVTYSINIFIGNKLFIAKKSPRLIEIRKEKSAGQGGFKNPPTVSSDLEIRKVVLNHNVVIRFLHVHRGPVIAEQR